MKPAGTGIARHSATEVGEKPSLIQSIVKESPILRRTVIKVAESSQ